MEVSAPDMNMTHAAMKRAFVIPLIILFCTFSNKIWSQTDSIKTDKVTKIICYLGLGAGPSTRGVSGELSLTVTSSNYWGGSFNFRRGYSRMKNMPEDYYGFLRFSPPTDDYTFLSFDLIKKFSTPTKYVRFGFEAGPSLVWYNLVELELNPDYPRLFQYKYNKIYTSESAFGLSITAKVEFPFSRYFGCDFTVFSVINKIQSVMGLDICLNFGKVRD